jgi:ribosomal protein S19
MRSVWKNRILLKNTGVITRPSFYTVDSSFLNKRVLAYNGRKFFSFIVRDYMLNFKFSNFLCSKITGSKIHIKKKKKKRK